MVISQKFRKLVALQCSQNNYSIADQSDRLCKLPNQRFFACKPENKLVQAVYLIWRIRAYLIYIYVYIPKHIKFHSTESLKPREKMHVTPFHLAIIAQKAQYIY